MNEYCPFKYNNVEKINIGNQPMDDSNYKCDKYCKWYDKARDKCIIIVIRDILIQMR